MAQQRIRASKLPEILAQFGKSPEAEAIQSAVKGFTSGADLASTLAARKQAGRQKELQIQQLQDKISAEKEKQAAMKRVAGSQPVTPETPASTLGFGPDSQPATLGDIAPQGALHTAIEPTALAGDPNDMLQTGEQTVLPGTPSGITDEIEESRQAKLQEDLLTAFPEKFAESKLEQALPEKENTFEQKLSLMRFGLDKKKAASLDKFKEEGLKLRKDLSEVKTGEARQRTLTQIDNAILRAEKEFGEVSGIRGFFEDLFGGIPGLEGGQEVLGSLKARREELGGAPTGGSVTPDMAKQLLSEAGGDKEKARELARQRGLQF